MAKLGWATIGEDGRMNRMKRWRYIALFLAVLSVGTLWAYLRIHTYSTGQDPRTFLVLARGLAEGKGLSQGVGFVVPGWPLILAGVIRLFGIHAAFWTNVPLFVLLIWTVQAFCADLTGSARRGAAIAICATLVLLNGYVNNPHYLLWAFRQTPIYLTSALALLCLERAGACQVRERNGAAAGWLGGSFLALAGSLLIRETGGLLLPAMGLYVLAAPLGGASEMDMTPPRGARKRLAGMFFGVVFAAVLGCVVVMWTMGGAFLSGQGRLVIDQLSHLLGSTSVDERSLPSMIALVPTELGVSGMIALGIGVVRACRHRYRGFLFLLLVPALSYLLFDGLIKLHTRFFLSTLFFLSPVVGLGAMTCVEGAQRLTARMWNGRHRSMWMFWLRQGCWSWGVWIALGVWGVWTILHLGSWGARVSRSQADHALELLRPYAEAGQPLLVDGRSRFLKDLVDVFTDWRTEAVSPENAAAFVCDPPRLFVDPLNLEALHWAIEGPEAHDILERYADLVLVPGTAEFMLGAGEYRMVQVQPWIQHKTCCLLPPPPVSRFSPPPPFIWLRLTAPTMATNTPIRVSLGGRVLAERLKPGYCFLPVPADGLAGAGDESSLSLELEAETPIPSTLHPVWIHPDAPVEMDFGVTVQPSYEAYLSDEFQAFAYLRHPVREYPYWKIPFYAREFAGEGTLYWPETGLKTTEQTTAYAVTLGLQSVYTDTNSTYTATLTLPEFPDVPPQSYTLPLSSSLRAARFSFGALPHAPHQIRLHITSPVVYPEDLLQNVRRSNYQLHSASLITLRAVDALQVPVGTWEDATLLGSGFLSRESPRSSEHGRWTSDCAEIQLPLQKGRDYQVQLTYASHRPANAPKPSPRLLFNGTPLEAVDDETTLTARLSAARLQEINVLQLLSTPWSPGDYGIHNDDRVLGIFLREIRVTPL